MPQTKEPTLDLSLVREKYTPVVDAGYRFLTPSILWDKHGGQICEFSLYYSRAQEYAEAPQLVLDLLDMIEDSSVKSVNSVKVIKTYDKLIHTQEKEILELRKRVGTAEAKLKQAEKST